MNEEADDGVLYEAYLKHVYSSRKAHTIGVNGKARTLNCYDAGLTELWCSSNKLSALDVSRNTALTQLDCGNNNFSVDAMNAIYNALSMVL